MKHETKFSPYTHPAGGWGSVQSLGHSLARQHVPLNGARVLTRQNKLDGVACVGCAWAKPAKPHPFEFCDEGAKATTCEITAWRCSPGFFAKRSVSYLASWTDHELEEHGQKSAIMGTPVIVALSAPTALAVRASEAVGLTLIGIARKDSFELFTHPERIGGNLP